MKQEGVPKINQKDIKQAIHVAERWWNTPLNETEQRVVKKIIASAPASMDTRSLNKWCAHKVRDIIKHDQGLRKETKIKIKRYAQNELLLKVLKPELSACMLQVKNKKMKSITPKQIHNINRGLYEKMKEIRDLEGDVDWEFIKKRSRFMELKFKKIIRWNPKKIVKAITEIVKTLNPKTYNAYWLEQHISKGLGGHVQKFYDSNWRMFTEETPEDVKKKFVPGEREESKETKRKKLQNKKYQAKLKRLRKKKRIEQGISFNRATAQKTLSELLEQKKEGYVSPTYIWTKNRRLYLFYMNHVRTSNGKYINWDAIIPKKFKNRWKPLKKFEEELPEKIYEDPNEVSEVLGERKAKLHLLTQSSEEMNTKDAETRDEICNLLLTLAKEKGNLSAAQTLTNLLEYSIYEWIEKTSSLRRLKNMPEVIKEIIQRSIYLYRPGKVPFIHYLLACLRQMAVHTQKVEAFSINQDAHENSRTTKAETTISTEG